jgi:hypothetical protein
MNQAMINAPDLAGFQQRVTKALSANKADKGGKSKGDSDVRSPTSTDVRSPTSTETSTEAYTAGNVTVTGGAGDGDTVVRITQAPNDGDEPDENDETLPKPAAAEVEKNSAAAVYCDRCKREMAGA